MHILVANEPRSYREGIAAAVQLARPHHEAVVVSPADLDQAFARLRPQLVICSSLTDTIKAQAPSWLLLYPEAQALAVLGSADHLTTITDVTLDQLLAIVDTLAGPTAPALGSAASSMVPNQDQVPASSTLLAG